jgi:hypothetical protein
LGVIIAGNVVRSAGSTRWRTLPTLSMARATAALVVRAMRWRRVQANVNGLH